MGCERDSLHYRRRNSIASPVVRLWVSLWCLGAFLIGSWQLDRASPTTNSGVLPIEPPTPYLHFLPDSDPIDEVVLVHGLNSNKEFMRTLGMAMAEAGFETYAIDLPGHGDSNVPFSAIGSSRAIEAALDYLGSTPILVGHSMGGGLLVDLAPIRSFRKIVLLSPAPVPLENLDADHVLIVTGNLDAPRINEFIPTLIGAAGPAGEWWSFQYAGHSSALFNPTTIRLITEWMGGRPDSTRTLERIGWLILMSLAGIVAAWSLLPGASDRPELLDNPDVTRTLVTVVAASGAALLVLRVIVPLAWTRLFATDYLMSFLLVTGLLLWHGQWPRTSRLGLGIGLLSAAYAIGVFAVGVGSHLIHLMPSGGQWLRFPVFVVVSMPLFMFDELHLRSIRSGPLRALTFVTTRIILWSAVVTGVLLLNPESSFLVLITHLVVLFWLVLWWMSGFVRRATADPVATAMFASLVQGWAFAALFVRI